MKKLFFTLLLSLMTLTSNAQVMKLGDLNHDNQVNITDVMTLVDIVLHGYSPFSVSPSEVTMQVGDNATVSVVGGYYYYEVVSADPNVVEASVFGATVTLTAVGGGETTVTVKDVLTFRTIDISVVVNYESLQVSTNELSLIAGARGTVEINSGSGYYSVHSSDANVATASVSGGTVTVTAVGAGEATVTITDIKTDQMAVVDVKVGYMPIALSSSSLGLSIGDESRVSVTSGSGSYEVQSSDANVATAVMDGSSVVVTAVGGGTATITVTDTNSGQSATITVTVEYFPLTLSASSLELNIGDEETVNITSGNASFTVASSDTGVATAKLVGFSVKVTAVGAGTATITVTDRRSGETAAIEATVNDNQPQSYLTCPDDHHPHLIDLGLPSGTKWACCNVDTDHPENQSPTNYGGYYAWGETETKSTYNWSTYIHCDGTSSTSHYLGDNICGSQYDVAHVKWGNNWQMPTNDQFKELMNNCSFNWTTMDNVKGCKCTGPNGGQIFLPSTGYRSGASDLYYRGEGTFFYSGTQDPDYHYRNGSYRLSLIGYGSYPSPNGHLWFNGGRDDGFPVRPVDISNSNLLLSSNRIKDLLVGENFSVSINFGSGNYSTNSDHLDVATATVNKSSVTVTALKTGNAIITVKDNKSNQTVNIEVAVTSSLCPDNNHPHMIDLGLPSGTKWACCNVGATTPDGYGGYYAWGETEEKDVYSPSTYQFAYADNDETGWWDDETYTGYWHFIDIGSHISGTQYDVAHIKWGNGWKMPTREQIEELNANCSHIWTSMNGEKGYKFTSYNGGNIFLPAAGGRETGIVNNYYNNFIGYQGYYWSDTCDGWGQAYTINFSSRYTGLDLNDEDAWENYYLSNSGYSVRPVIGK